MITDFNEYWKPKREKEVKKWSGRARSMMQRHLTLEEVRTEVFIPFSDMPAFDNYSSLKLNHFCLHNPIAKWGANLEFSFCEEQLREALRQHGGDGSKLKMEHSKRNFTRETVEDSDWFAWLKQRYDADQVETVTLTYGQAEMVINRYTMPTVSFGYYELNPCISLSDDYTILLEETEFNTLDVSSLLMEMDAECELRQEELNYLGKRLKLFGMEAATTSGIEFKILEGEQLEAKLQEYAQKGFDSVKQLEMVLRQWRTAVRKFIEGITYRDFNEENQRFSNCRYTTENLQDVAIPYFKRHLPDGAVVNLSTRYYDSIDIKYQGYKTIISWDGSRIGLLLCCDKKVSFYVGNYYQESIWKSNMLVFNELTLSAIVEYVKLTPEFNQLISDTRAKILNHAIPVKT